MAASVVNPVVLGLLFFPPDPGKVSMSFPERLEISGASIFSSVSLDMMQ